MTAVRLLGAAAVAALLAGPVAAQTTETTQSTSTVQAQSTGGARTSLSTSPGMVLQHADAMTAEAAEAAAKPSASESGANDGQLEVATVTSAAGMSVQVVANTPIPDTPSTRAQFGQPESRAGKRSAPESPGS